MSTKMATVRDLRNHYTSILSWLKAGEEVFITRKGATFARLVPETNTPQSKKVDWMKSAAFAIDHSKEKILTAKESASLLKKSQGRW